MVKLNIVKCLGQSEEGSLGSIPDGKILPQMRKQNRLIGLPYTVLISTVLMHQDIDSTVATQATYRLNGCRTSLREALSLSEEMSDEAVEASSFLTSAENVVPTLLKFSSDSVSDPLDIPSSEGKEGMGIKMKRTALRSEIRASILRWLAKDATEYLPDHLLDCIQCVNSIILLSTNDNDKALGLKVASLVILTSLLKSCSDETLRGLDKIKLNEKGKLTITRCHNESYSDCLFDIVMTVVENDSALSASESSYRFSEAIAGSQNIVGSRMPDKVDMRKLVYNTLEYICRLFPSKASSNLAILQSLFRFIPVENEENIPSLFCALGSLKLAYEAKGSICTIW